MMKALNRPPLLRRALLCAALAVPALGGVALAEGVFKNLQVLPKETDKPTLKKIMKEQAKGLGVECDYCHKEPNMAEDTDKKKLSREMMRLVEEINAGRFKADAKVAGPKDLVKARAYYAKKFAGQKDVTCNTCHQGKEEPPK
jgi:hypothetical protein